MSTKRDQRIADETLQHDAALMCRVGGCPNPWSVDGPAGRCCSAHAWAQPHQWARITDEQLDAQARRAMRASQEQPKPRKRPMTIDEKRAIGQKLRQAIRQQGGRQWAHKLRDREQRGEKLTEAQRSMWRDALGVHDEPAQAPLVEPAPQAEFDDGPYIADVQDELEAAPW
ncbi:hypothetical protein [Roseateles depolymerans]|uniref:Uncharacterized protein n=1 Tax=Roseateles depolymerans TaxID=76731 RepID=A0A0U3MEC1_9BURK|nr:hypothetical protein [Roseateles depolymerans]ALV06681.1 hypothetical protein RD2015_2209 [Roseateles depolymerans]REG19658.1 hypothetical protein DES44_2158 [Roseateles depolymerans]